MNINLSQKAEFSIKDQKIVDNNEFSKNLIKKLDSSEKISSFLFGVVLKKAMNIDYVNGSNKLQDEFNLKFLGTFDDVKKFYIKSVKILKENNVNIPELEVMLSTYLLLSDGNLDLSRDDTKFFITIGETTNYLN